MGSLPLYLIAHFSKRRCWAGVDLSMTTDLTAVAFVFPGDDETYDVLPFLGSRGGIAETGIARRDAVRPLGGPGIHRVVAG